MLLVRWLLDSAERSHQVALSIITSGLMDGLKHSISRHDIISLTPRLSHQSKIYDSKRRVKRLLSHRIEAGPKSQLEKKPSPKKDSSHTSLHDKAGYAPSIGSRHGSDFSLVSSTVETAAHIARSSIRSSETAAKEVKVQFLVLIMLIKGSMISSIAKAKGEENAHHERNEWSWIKDYRRKGFQVWRYGHLSQPAGRGGSSF